MSIKPKKYAIILKDNNGKVINYIENIVSKLSWDWNRIGGCGACKMEVQTSWDSVLAGSFDEDYSVEIFVPDVSGTSALWYSGYIDKVTPNVTAKDEKISIFALGYVNQLKRIIIRNKSYSGSEISSMAKDILDSYVTPLTDITSTAANYEETGFSADSLVFNESAFDAITTLSQIAGKREWGVDADKAFFFKARNENTSRYYNITEDFTKFTPKKDFHSIITRIFLVGGEPYNARFTVTNRKSLREKIISNSSIITQSVGQQYARSFLKEKGIPRRSFSATLIDQNIRIEKTIPIGAADVNIKRGINIRYDVGTQLYDTGLKYDGGTESYQIEKIKYTLTDSGINVKLSFGPLPPTLADDLETVEYLINNERNR